MRKIQLSLGVLVLAGVAAAGCTPSSTSTTSTTAATMPAAPMAMGPAAPMVPPPAAKDLTHVLTMDEPYFASMPTPGAPPSGTLKAGCKVLVVLPGVQYSQIVSDTGISAFTVADGLKALGK